jgi:hypothetical protein
MQPTQAEPLDPHEMLFVVPRKRFVPVYYPNESGIQELTLHVGEREISFDEPELFPWAEKLIEQDSFMAAAATTWSAQPLEWPRVQTLLDSLIEAGILSRTRQPSVLDDPAQSPKHKAFLAFEARRKTVDGPRSWRDPASTLQEIAGRSVEAGYIESIVPVYRLAHIAVDREGRQVGELNTTPDALRLKVETEFKTCGYAGSRYRSPLPMNMTALRSMIAHWKPVLKATLLCREEFLRRYPQPGEGRWRLGELYFAGCHILALPAVQLMRERDPVAPGELDPVLSSLFRVVDGVRMIAGHMLDLYERPMVHDSIVDAKQIATSAEREDQYRTYHGVCAGPPAMIDELLATLMDGKPLDDAGIELGNWTQDIPLALDYALLGIQIYAVYMTVWVRMGLAFTRIREALLRSPDLTSGRLGKLREGVERAFERIVPGRNNLKEQRDFSEPFYQRMFWHAQTGVRGFDPSLRKDLAVVLQPAQDLLTERALGVVRDLFASAEEPALAAAHSALLSEIAGHVLEFLRFERTALGVIVDVARQIDDLLGRPHPDAPFTGTKLGANLALNRTNGFRGQFYLLDTIAETLGIETVNERDGTTLRLGDRTVDLH